MGIGWCVRTEEFPSFCIIITVSTTISLLPMSFHFGSYLDCKVISWTKNQNRKDFGCKNFHSWITNRCWLVIATIILEMASRPKAITSLINVNLHLRRPGEREAPAATETDPSFVHIRQIRDWLPSHFGGSWLTCTKTGTHNIGPSHQKWRKVITAAEHPQHGCARDRNRNESCYCTPCL